MMRIMQNRKPNARAAAKDATHERIVAVAARAIRRSGYDGTGVANIMKEAGLTHGAFYAHFTSREAMLAEAAGRACAESAAAAADVVARVPPEMALASMLRAYLSIGAKICGPPALDCQFKMIDFLTLLDLHAMPALVRARFLGAQAPLGAPCL